MLAHDCNPAHLYEVIRRDRGFIRTLKGSVLTHQDVKDAIAGDYVPISNKQTLEVARAIVDEDREAAITAVLSEKEPTAVTYATGQELLRRLQQGNAADVEKAISIAEHLAETATQQGQAIQALSMWNRLTPEGALGYATKVAKRNKTKVTPEHAKKIKDKAGELRDVKNKNERAVKTGELMKEIAKLEKPTFGNKLSTIQAMAQLLNVKTAARNVLGNTLFAAAETSSNVLAAGLDTALSAITGKRTKVMPQLAAARSGFVQGAQKGLRDAIKGIDTGAQGTKFDLPKAPVFKNPVMRGLETAMNIELRATDRAFYEMAFRESAMNQVKASGKREVTPDMLAIAHQDALYKTFQDDSAAAHFFMALKRGFNVIGVGGKKRWYAPSDFGLGDFVLKYPKTPGNLLSRAFAYSPAGYLKAMYEIGKPFLTGTEFNQKNFVEAFSRATTGSVGIGMAGYTLGKLGLATGEYGGDKDIEAVKKIEGIGPYRLNASGLMRYSTTLNPQAAQPQEGDVWYSYDWAQPMAVPFAAAVNIAHGKAESLPTAITQGVFEGADTLTQQGVVKGLQDFFASRDDQGKPNVIEGLQNVAANAPSSFVPTALSQANQAMDNTTRETWDPSILKQSLNKAAAKIPGAAQMLPTRYDVYGQPMERYQAGTNDLFNVFLNPAFVSKLKADPVGTEVLSIYNQSGETKQAPRTVPKTIRITKAGHAQQLPMTPELLGQYQQAAGQKTKAVFDQLVAMPEFQQLSDESKADVMSSAMTDIHTVVKKELFGHTPKKMNYSTRLLDRGLEQAYIKKLRGAVRKKMAEDRKAS